MTRSHRIFYSLLKPVLPLLRMLMAKLILTTESVGRAMLAVARKGAGTPLLEASAIAALGQQRLPRPLDSRKPLC